jgi:hypothetical protein
MSPGPSLIRPFSSNKRRVTTWGSVQGGARERRQDGEAVDGPLRRAGKEVGTEGADPL